MYGTMVVCDEATDAPDPQDWGAGRPASRGRVMQEGLWLCALVVSRATGSKRRDPKHDPEPTLEPKRKRKPELWHEKLELEKCTMN